VSRLNLAHGQLGPDGAPQPAFVFQEEEKGGTTPKILVQDNARRLWSVKWGSEVHAEVFASRLLWAAGYVAEPSYYVRHGNVDSVGALGRAERFINRANGNSFHDARFELRDKNVSPLIKSWRWDDNPFTGTRELNGLKIMSVLLSNWDAKDARDKGSNTAVIRVREDGGSERTYYLINDWGACLGRWGGFVTREKWNCADFASQTDSFVKGVEGGRVKFGFNGKRAAELAKQITAADVRWIMQYAGRITDSQLRDALRASGATAAEMGCFTAALRNRIEQLRRVASGEVDRKTIARRGNRLADLGDPVRNPR
jgi:hypothetical protein